MLSVLNEESVFEESDCVCPDCGLTGIEISWDMRPGCPTCYKYFNSILAHNYANSPAGKYSGKRPVNYIEVMEHGSTMIPANKVTLKKELTELEEDMRMAVLEERYEDAAVLRDRIKEVKRVE